MNLADLPRLFDEQQLDGRRHDELLVASNRALDAGNLAEAERFGQAAYAVLVRIRVRSKAMADIVDDVEHRIDDVAACSAGG